MILDSRVQRFSILAVFSLYLLVLIIAPIAMVVLSAFSSRWVMTIFPTAFTLKWFETLRLRFFDSVIISLVTALAAGFLATCAGTYAAYIIKRKKFAGVKILDTVLMYPIALPSVVTGLYLLNAFHAPPFLLTGTPVIVILAHFLIVFPFVYRIICSVLDELDPMYEEAAQSLGANEVVTFFKVTFPLISPGMLAGFVLAFCLSIGELGATMMVYPPTWKTMTVDIYNLVERGFYYPSSAMSLILIVVGFTSLAALSIFLKRHRHLF
jgi:2-aminoethylphosphonate transport system permease protein